MRELLKQLREISQIIAVRFFRDRFAYAASALTFTTLLALVPLLSISLSVLTVFPVFNSMSANIQAFIFENFIPASGHVVQKYLQAFITQATHLSFVGILFLIVMAVAMMLTIEHALNDVWKVQHTRNGMSAWVRYWAVLSLVPIFISIAIAAVTYFFSLPFFVSAASGLGIKAIILRFLPFIFTVVAFSILYIVVPNCKVPFWYGFIGALISAFLFEVAKKGFVIYITSFPTYRLIYGAFATIPIFLIWIYLSWVIVLFGALVSNVLATHRFVKTGESIDGFTHAFVWLGYLWRAQQKGETVSVYKLRYLLPGKYQIEVRQMLDWLLEKRLIHMIENNQYMLSRDFSQMTLSDLYRALPWKLPEQEASILFSQKMNELLKTAHQSLHNILQVPLSELYESSKIVLK